MSQETCRLLALTASSGGREKDRIRTVAKPASAVAALTCPRHSDLRRALLGAFIVGGVGFSHIEAVHNAAHDYRHSMAFPCH
jgi:cobalt transporter subunit CbtB